MEFVEKVKKFNDIAGNDKFDPKQTCLYVGLIFEELKEFLESFNSEDWNETIQYMNDMSQRFKRGDYVDYIESDKFNREEALDAAVDISVVALGAGIAVGSDIISACHEVADNNLSKFNYNETTGEHTVLKDSNGKICKPENYVPVTLGKYLK